MTSILAALGRATGVAVLVLLCVAAVLWAAYGPQGFWTVAWLMLMAVMIIATGLGVAALSPKEREPGQAVERHARQAVPRHRKGDA